MNAKKPYLAAKTRKIPISYLVDGEEVMLQRLFFDYMMNLASAGKYDVYVDTVNKKILAYGPKEIPQDIEAGYYLRIKKGKEVCHKSCFIYNEAMKDFFSQYNRIIFRDFIKTWKKHLTF